MNNTVINLITALALLCWLSTCSKTGLVFRYELNHEKRELQFKWLIDGGTK